MAYPTAWTKLDQDTVADDNPASALLSVGARRNTIANNADRHIAASHGYRQDIPPPEFSTHPDLWYEIPILVEAVTGATTLTVTLSHVVADASVKAKIHLEGVEGSEVTITAGAWDYTALTVTVPQSGGDGWWRGGIAIRSQVGSAVLTSADIVNTYANGAVLAVDAGTGSLSTGKSHYLLILSSTSRGSLEVQTARYHVPHVAAHVDTGEGDYMVNVWPERTESLSGPLAYDSIKVVKDVGTFYEVGKITIYGYGLVLSGAGEIPIPAKASIGAGQPIQAPHMRGLYSAATRLYRERGRWLACGPAPVRQYWHGARVVNSSAIVGSAGYIAREDGDGVRFGALWVPIGVVGNGVIIEAGRASATWTGYSIPTGGGGVSSSVSRTESSPAFRAMRSLRDAADALLLVYNLAQTPSSWGAGSLGLMGEVYRLPLVDMQVPHDSGVVAGDNMRAAMLVDDAYCWVGAFGIREVVS